MSDPTNPWDAIAGIGTLVAAGVAAVASVAAWKSAKAAADAAQVTRHAELLDSIPLVIPWIQSGEGLIMNRGTSEAFNLHWKTLALPGLTVLGEDDIPDVMPVKKPFQIFSPTSVLSGWVARDRADSGVRISCTYDAPWGEEFTVTREIEPRRNGKIRVFDGQGREIKIAL